MKNIAISVRDKIAINMSDVPYTCGNSDFVVNFDFDEEWNAYDVKTARFIKDDRTFQDQVFQGNECPVPIIYNTNKVRVGVFAGNLNTSTYAIIKANKSILCGNGSPEAPKKDVYAQLMEMFQGIAVLTQLKTITVEVTTLDPGSEATAESRIADEKMTIVFGIPDGKPGDKGDPGEKGDTGRGAEHSWNGTVLTVTSASGTSSADLKGEKGDTGRGAEHSWNGTVLTVTSASGTSSADLKGDKGDTGSGFKVLDYYDTLEALEAAIPSPEAGVAYGIGTAEPYDIYIYGETSGWVNNGPLQGAQGSDGSDGSDGEDGVSPVVSITAIDGGHRITITDVNGEQSFDVIDGVDGSNGSDGQDGEDGHTPEKGVDYFTEQEKAEMVNEVLAAMPTWEGGSY